MSEYDQRSHHDTAQPSELAPTVWGSPEVWGAPAQVGPADIQPTQASADQPVDMPPAGAGKRVSTMAKTLTAVGVAAVIAVGGTVAITAANASTSTVQNGPGGGQGGPGGQGGFGGGQGGFGGGAPGGAGTGTGTGTGASGAGTGTAGNTGGNGAAPSGAGAGSTTGSGTGGVTGSGTVSSGQSTV